LWPRKSRETKKASGTSKGPETRKSILAHSLRVAASHGLAGLTIGRLARDLDMSKSGLFAHFRSKRVLELATINEARKIFTSQVLVPATGGNDGIERLWILCDSWLAHIERRVFPGGYFFTGAFFECAERSGAVEAEINAMAREWWNSLKSAVLKAQDRKEINPAADARRVSFDLNGILMAAYWAFLVEKDVGIFHDARIALLAKLEGLATARIPAGAFKSENAWKEYLRGKHIQEEENPLSALRRLGGKKAQFSAHSPSIHPPKKSKSVLDNLKRLTKKLKRNSGAG
jgi:AcrR family transcriptional regulator